MPGCSRSAPSSSSTLYLPKGILGTLAERLGARRAKVSTDIPPALAEEGRGS